MCWSSGKDSAWALHTLRTRGEVEVAGLLTTINQAAGRVAMHAVRERLLEMQAEALGLPLTKVLIPEPCSNEQYEAAMAEAVGRAMADGVTAMAFGDLFLEDIRRYREEKLAPTGITPLFPIWGLETAQLARDMVGAGLRAHVTCVDPKQLDPSFAGRTFDDAMIDALPEGVDPCGERGEFHTFAYQGPMFARPIEVRPGVVVERAGFVFADVVPATPMPAETVHEPGTGTLEVWPLDPTEHVLYRLLAELFERHWAQITFGPLIQGAAWEIRATAPPEKLVLHDGYLTVDLGGTHFHLCIGEHRGDPGRETPPDLARKRRTGRAEFFRRINTDGTPDTWGLRLINGQGEQQLTVLLPNPFVTDDQQFRHQPDWSQLALWDQLRLDHLGLPPDDRDRSGTRMLYP